MGWRVGPYSSLSHGRVAGDFGASVKFDPCSLPPFAASNALGLAQIADGATERFGQLAIKPFRHRAVAFFQCLDRVMGDAEPFGELPWRQTGALAQLAQVCLPSWVPHR
jgi:hypothetical protein